MRYLILSVLWCAFTLSLSSCSSKMPASDDKQTDIVEDDTVVDLDVGWISRAPEIEYVWGSSDPSREGWPQVGQEVVWQANVKNWSRHDLQNVEYIWSLDGVKVASGVVDIPASSYATVDYPWVWTFERHVLRFTIDPRHLIDDEQEELGTNNLLDVYTNAITIGFYVEESICDLFRSNEIALPAGVKSIEDWLQRQIKKWNSMAGRAIYPETPSGVLDRIRIDKIDILPDGSITGFYCPEKEDRTIDLQWGIPAEMFDAASIFYRNDDLDYYGNTMLHELGHARYLVDIYAFDLYDGYRSQSISIEEEGKRVAGSKYMPYVGPLRQVYDSPEHGIMKRQGYTFFSRYSATALNLIAGHRAVLGNCNAPENLGSYLLDLPAQNRLTVKDESGDTLRYADIKIYQFTNRGYYDKRFDDIPDVELVTDTAGRALLGKDPFNLTNLHPTAPSTIIIRVEHDGKVGYGFLESRLFNMEYWRGNTELGEYELVVELLG
jgi:hypothetical protein